MSRSARAAALSVDPILTATFGPEAEDLPPALAARLLEVLAQAKTDAANTSQPAFFEALSWPATSQSSMGGTWETPKLSIGVRAALATTDRALAGLSGVAEVLAAGEWARAVDDAESQLTMRLADHLFHALASLANYARENLEQARGHLTEGPGQ